MRPVAAEFGTSQGFGSMATQGVVGNVYASMDTAEYWVGRYGNYQPFGHAGEDMACPVGTPVHAMSAGTVLFADWGHNLPGTGPVREWLLYATFPGIVSVIQHWWGIGVYAHLSTNEQAPAGTVVAEGQVIGLSGDTGGVDAHLHVEALVDLSYRTGGGLIYGRTDPTPYFGATAPATEEDPFMPALTEQEQRRILAWADRGNAVVPDPNAQILTTKHVADIVTQTWGVELPLAGGGTTTPATKVKYQKQEFNALGAKVDQAHAAESAQLAALAGVVATLAGPEVLTKEEILAQLDATVTGILGKFKPTFVEEESK